MSPSRKQSIGVYHDGFLGVKRFCFIGKKIVAIAKCISPSLSVAFGLRGRKFWSFLANKIRSLSLSSARRYLDDAGSK